MDGWMDGWMDGMRVMDGWMDGWSEGDGVYWVMGRVGLEGW